MNTPKPFSSLITLAAAAAVLLAGAPSTTLAAKSNPNPFAGEYCDGPVIGIDSYRIELSVSSSGRATGWMGNAFVVGPVAGRISADGVVNLTWRWERTALGWYEVNFPLPYKTVSIFGIVTKDANGNLIGVVQLMGGWEYSLTASPCN